MRQTPMDRWIEAAEPVLPDSAAVGRAINGTAASDQLSVIQAAFGGAARDPRSAPGSRRRIPVERVGIATQQHAAE